MNISFRDFFLDMSEIERTKYAKSAGTTVGYIKTHLITKYKVPRPELMNRLVDASKGELTMSDLTDFFYNNTEKTKNINSTTV